MAADHEVLAAICPDSDGAFAVALVEPGTSDAKFRRRYGVANGEVRRVTVAEARRLMGVYSDYQAAVEAAVDVVKAKWRADRGLV